MGHSFNVVIFGEVGVGKRSVINLIAGRKVAETSPDAKGCTLESQQYTFYVGRRSFNVWDTIGLREPVFSVTDYLSAIEKTYTLIQQIAVEGGLDLLLFCITGKNSQISQTMLCNYRLFFEVLCEKRIPIALVVTHLEKEKLMDDWWARNERYISQCGLKFSGHACVTGLPGHDKEMEGRITMENLLLGYDDKERYAMPSTGDWDLAFLGRLATSVIPRPLKAKDKRRRLENLLRVRSKMHAVVARRLAESLTLPTPESFDAKIYQFKNPNQMTSSFNIVLFGEAGVGKSSVINLIADKHVAETSDNSWGCTLESKQHRFSVAQKTFNIWDTIGLGEASFSTTNYLSAIVKTFELIQQIEAKGGLDLLLFCIPGNGTRISQAMVSNYRLFFEVFCEKRIPIAVVVTRLEGIAKMEEWWGRNEKHIAELGLKFGGHACITGQREHPNAAKGRAALELLLLSYDNQWRYPMPPASVWFSGFLDRLPTIPRSREVSDKQTEVARLLRRRCMMDSGIANQLAQKLTQLREGDN